MPTARRRSCGCSDGRCSDIATPSHASEHTHHEVREKVREGYAEIARSGCCGGANGTTAAGAAAPPPSRPSNSPRRSDTPRANSPPCPTAPTWAFPAAIPPRSRRFGGVGVPRSGAGGGFDCFVAGPAKIGAETGPRYQGVDMTPDMLGKARAMFASYREQTGLDNVEFRAPARSSASPVADASVNVVISNCV